jgi:hypothetical protein
MGRSRIEQQRGKKAIRLEQVTPQVHPPLQQASVAALGRDFYLRLGQPGTLGDL